MAMNTLPLRHELKFFINEMQYYVLSGILDHVLQRDPNGDEYNEYHIRSLYFDTVYNTALLDKMDGVPNRDKYRIRIYNFSDRVIKMECKTKVGSLISKRSISIPRVLCEQLMAGDPTGLETTRSGLLTSPLRARFGIQEHLEYYDYPVLGGIIKRSASILNIGIEDEAATEIAMRSRGTPRIANNLLRRVRDFAQVKGNGTIDLAITRYALNALNIDKRGLDAIDNKILTTIIEKFKGGPVGASTIATAISEDQGTFEEVYEPFLIKEGFIRRTPRGREATDLAYSHLGLSRLSPDNTLF